MEIPSFIPHPKISHHIIPQLPTIVQSYVKVTDANIHKNKGKKLIRSGTQVYY